MPAPGTGIHGAAAFLFGIVLTFVCDDPAFANKFETIGGGFSGSAGIKREWLQWLFVAGGALGLLGAIMAVVIPHRNALFLNYANWRASAVVLTVIACVLFAAAALI